MLNTYIGDCDNCKGNCRECENRPVTMVFRSVANECLPVESFIEALEMFPHKGIFFDGQTDVQLNISDEYINITSVKPNVPQGEFQF